LLDEAALAAIPASAGVLLDSLTTHLAARLWADEAALLAAYAQGGPRALEPWLDGLTRLLEHARRWRAAWVVSDELGCSLVPEHALGRAFRDLVGTANQRLAAASQRVAYVVAGRMLELIR
jgi:adenosylcobinamide kinase/adenosylcobinamide-phosphate guanylyltransferase